MKPAFSFLKLGNNNFYEVKLKGTNVTIVQSFLTRKLEVSVSECKNFFFNHCMLVPSSFSQNEKKKNNSFF